MKKTTEEVMIAYSEAQAEYTKRRKACGEAVGHCRVESEGACTFPNCLRNPEDGGYQDCERSPEIYLVADASWDAKKARGKARAAVLQRAHALARKARGQ